MLLCVDGGGSKLITLLLDDRYNVISVGRSGGVNVTQGSVENTKSNVKENLAMLFAGHPVYAIEHIYSVFVGPFEIFLEELHAYCGRIGEVHALGEGDIGNLSVGLRKYGVCANAGTGSDVFYAHENGTSTIGGWGPYVGDDGSGAIMGQEALRAVVRDFDGWGPNTMITELLKQEWQLSEPWDVVTLVQTSPAPFRKIASVTRIIGKAARLGDETAMAIIRNAAQMMADQTFTLFKRFDIPMGRRDIALFGGAWKVHPSMAERYTQLISKGLPGVSVITPVFEPVCGGLVMHLLNNGLPSEEIRDVLNEKMREYRIKVEV